MNNKHGWPRLGSSPEVMADYYLRQHGKRIAKNYLRHMNGEPILALPDVPVPTLNQYIAVKALSLIERGAFMGEICDHMSLLLKKDGEVTRHQSSVSNSCAKGLMDKMRVNGDRRYTYFLNHSGKAAIEAFEEKYGTENPLEEWGKEQENPKYKFDEIEEEPKGQLGITDYIVLKTLIDNHGNENLFPAEIHKLAQKLSNELCVDLTVGNVREKLKLANKSSHIRRRPTNEHRKPFAYSISEEGRRRVVEYESTMIEEEEAA